jgi:MFS transporter, ACS family, glucarate transporter
MDVSHAKLQTTADAQAGTRVGRVRYTIIAMLFIATVVNYADRATLSIAAPTLGKDLGLDALKMGIVFSAFGWAYVLAQLPGGWLLDRFGSKRVYFASIALWSVFTLLQGTVVFLAGTAALYSLFILRFMVGIAEAPCFPGNARIVATWFPASERGTASALFNAAQYFATILFAPIMGWITYMFGWPWVFYFMGALGLMLAVGWQRWMHMPLEHPRMEKAELDYIRSGGALVDVDRRAAKTPQQSGQLGANLKALLTSRMMWGIYLGQFTINTLTYFFITWFPVYLVQQRGMSILNAGLVASIPALCGFAGGVLGGVWSDALLRRGYSLTFARKLPIVGGMLVSTVMVACNYIDTPWLVVAAMALSFFGKGVGALGWAVVSDTVPKEIAGFSGGIFNTFGNLSSITTPIVIGYIVHTTGSFDGALVFVGANALVATLSYLVITGEIKRLAVASPLGHA